MVERSCYLDTPFGYLLKVCDFYEYSIVTCRETIALMDYNIDDYTFGSNQLPKIDNYTLLPSHCYSQERLRQDNYEAELIRLLVPYQLVLLGFSIGSDGADPGKIASLFAI